MSNRCPVCIGTGRIVAFAAFGDPVPVVCPECAGLHITPASADDVRRPPRSQLVEASDELAQAPVGGPVEAQ